MKQGPRMRYTFTAEGHENISANHRNTLELTKDKEVSKKGDCIIGVNATYDLSKIRKLLKKYNQLKMKLEADGVEEEITFTGNKHFTDKNEIVLRLGDFLSERTLGIHASKSSKMLNRKLIQKLEYPGQKLTITLEPMIKAIIFDFDETVAKSNEPIWHANNRLAEEFLKRYSIYPPTALKILYDVDKEYIEKGTGKTPEYYDRRIWFKEFFRRTGIKVTKEEINRYVKIYWEEMMKHARFFPGTKAMLKRLKKSRKLAIYTDCDGKNGIKQERMKKLGAEEYFDVIITGNHVGQNKPSRKMYEKILKKLKVKPEECIMVGDQPKKDLELGKKLGMITVWIKQGWRAKQYTETPHYVDHEIRNILELEKLIKDHY